MGDIISRKEAAQAALPVYFDGEFCKEGHLSDKYTVSGKCVECSKENMSHLSREAETKRKFVEVLKLRRERREQRGQKFTSIFENEEDFLKHIKTRLDRHKYREWGDGSVFSEVTPEEILEILEEQNYECKACYTHFSECGFEIEHIIPIKAFGGHHKKNIQLLCSTCNRSKKDREYKSWISSVRHEQVINCLHQLYEAGY